MPLIPFLTALLPLFTVLIATIARFAIKIFMKVFDWSTEIFFGKMPIDKSIKFTVLSALSMIWIITVVCIPFPQIAKITLGFFPAIARTNKLVIYLLNGSGVFFIPIIVGAISVFWNMQKITPADIQKLPYKRMFKGFYFTFYLGLGFMSMFVFSPIINLLGFIKRRRKLLVPATIHEGRYEFVLSKLRKVLKEQNIELNIKEMDIMHSIPHVFIGHLSDSLFKDLFVKNKKILCNKDLEIYIHHSDIMIVGREEMVKKVRIAITEVLMFDRTYLTWDERTKKMEDEISCIYSDFIISNENYSDRLMVRIEKLKNEIKSIIVDFNDFETIKLKILSMENLLLTSKIIKKVEINKKMQNRT